MKDNYRIKLDFNISNVIRIIDGTVNSAIKENKCVLSLDTRNLQQGDLFLAIKGNYSDGHIYIDQAFKEGASAAIISNIELFKRSDSPLIYVEDTYDALCKIAKYIRVRSKALRIAITGSVGKTTTKSYLANILSKYENTYSSPESFNNKWGVPISLAKINNKAKYALFEVGMNRVNEIEPLSELVIPDVSIITNIGEAHIGNLGSIKTIAIEKSNIMRGMSKDSTAILPHDSKYFNLIKDRFYKSEIKFITFGKSNKSDIEMLPIIKDKNNFILNFQVNGKSYKTISTKGNPSIFDNYMPVLAVANLLNLDLNDVLGRLEELDGPDGRWQEKNFEFNGGIVKLINDTYNASPDSMYKAIKSVSEYKNNLISRKIAIIGDMLELGVFKDKYHSKLIQLINSSNIDKVYFCGDILPSYFERIDKDKQVYSFKSVDDIQIKQHFDINRGDLIFLKGGNQIRLNKLVQDFINYLHL